MKKLLYIILILVVIGGGVFAWFYFSNRHSSSSLSLSNPSSLLPSLSSSLPTPSYTIADTFPKTETISIGTGNGAVEIKNFYKTLIDTEEGFIIMADNENYQISYDRSASIFYIHFRNTEGSQSSAENELLNILGIGQQVACKLNVLVFQAGQENSARLSFCANKVK